MLTLAAVLVSCVGVSNGFAQVRSGRPAVVPLNDVERCRLNGDRDACDRVESRRASNSDFADRFRSGRASTPTGQVVCGFLAPRFCDDVEERLEQVDGARETVRGLVDGAQETVRGLVDGAQETVDGGARTIESLKATLTNLVAETADALSKSRSADNDATRMQLHSREASRELLSFQDQVDQETSRRRIQRDERDAGLWRARSLTRTSARNIEYAQAENREATRNYHEVRAGSSSGGGFGTALAALNNAFTTVAERPGSFGGTASMGVGDDFSGLSCDQLVRIASSEGTSLSMSECQEFYSEIGLNSDGSFHDRRKWEEIAAAGPSGSRSVTADSGNPCLSGLPIRSGTSYYASAAWQAVAEAEDALSDAMAAGADEAHLQKLENRWSDRHRRAESESPCAP